MSKVLSSLILTFWCFAITYMLYTTIIYVNSEPLLTIAGFLGLLCFLGSGIDIILPEFIRSFTKGGKDE